jgi:hypothetical protein
MMPLLCALGLAIPSLPLLGAHFVYPADNRLPAVTSKALSFWGSPAVDLSHMSLTNLPTELFDLPGV